jgi:tetratricopeptide (TPR) repeat protein
MSRSRRQAGRRPGPEDAERLSDDELLARLRGVGIELDRATFAQWCAQACSAREIADAWERHARRHHAAAPHREWLWRGLATLWQRWCPDIPSYEALEAKMQDGYERLVARDAAAACRIWLDAWDDVLHLMGKAGIASIEEFDDRFRGTQSLFNWIQDLEAELWNAGLDDPTFLTARIRVCEEGLRRFPTDDQLLTENRQRALAESYARLGDPRKADDLYRGWLDADPRWGWGWIGWSDNYRFINAPRDLTRAEQLLQEGLAVPDVRDRGDLLDRLAGLYDEQGRHAEAEALWEQAKAAAEAAEAAESAEDAEAMEEAETTLDVSSWFPEARHKTTITFGGQGLPLSDLPEVAEALRGAAASASAGRRKVGRNDPCPCGSGKKFKKCCGQGSSTGASGRD